MLRNWIFGLLLIPLIFGGLRLAENETLNQLRLYWFDSLVRYDPRDTPDDSPFVLAAIDEVSLAEIGQWPWPRNKTAELLHALFDGGAAMVVMDINFAHPDRFSPDELGKMLGDEIGRAAVLDTDAMLEQAIARGPVVLGSFRSVQDRQPTGPRPRAFPVFAPGYFSIGSDPINHIPLFDDYLEPLPELANAAYSVANVMVSSDADGVLRELPLIVGAGDGSELGTELRFFLALEAVRIGLGEPQYIIKSTPSDRSVLRDFQGLRAVQLGQTDIPVSSSGAMRLYESVDIGAAVIPAADLMAGQAMDAVQGKIVFIGRRGIGMGDRATGSIGTLRRGIDMQVMAAEQIISGEYLHVPPAARWIEFALIWAVCIAVMLALSSRIRAQAVRMGLSVLAVFAPWAISLLAFSAPSWAAGTGSAQVHYLIDPNAAGLAGAITMLIGFAGRVIEAEITKSKLRTEFARYLSPVIVDGLARQGGGHVMEPATREITVMFVDVRGFTSISENLSAADTVSLVNKFLSVISDVIFAHDGTIDKFLGDGVMAFWNAPIDQPGHRTMAFEAGVEIVRKIDALNEEVQADPYWKDILGGRDLRVGVGVHTGKASVGNFGSEKRVDYSAVGDTVNSAARIESQCKDFSATLLLSEEAVPKARMNKDKLAGTVTLKGRKMVTRLYNFSPED
ncbi:MAG: adenylate/guanylate cyclase domain-containing protein [Pseudomonadota bacterium]